MPYALKHPLVGELRGMTGDGVVQFLGIKYACLQNVFAASELINYSGQEIINATRLGSICPVPSNNLEAEFQLIQKALPNSKGFQISATESLNLNVTIPLVHGQLPTTDDNLPVFVFVHGGGFNVGSSAWPQYDLARIVRLSTDLDMKVIGVSINYRVGIPGFLTSAEMQSAGYPANNGLRDQINAFQWVKRYIGGFGGDASNVTFIGESAGAQSGYLLLGNEEPLYRRQISMSGTSLWRKPWSIERAETAYASIIEALDLNTCSVSERLKKLVQTPPEKLIDISSTIPWLNPVMDGNLIKLQPSYEMPFTNKRQHTSWCEDIFIGDCQADGYGFASDLESKKTNLASDFCKSAMKTLSASPLATEELLTAYGISPDMSFDQVLIPLLQFINDIIMIAPTIVVAKNWHLNGDVYLYYFNEPNPWNGRWKGEATHILDVAYLFQNYNEYLDEQQRRVAETLAADYLRFVNGKIDWPAFTKDHPGARVYGPSSEQIYGTYVEGITSERSGRRKVVFELAEKLGPHGLDMIAKVYYDFFGFSG